MITDTEVLPATSPEATVGEPLHFPEFETQVDMPPDGKEMAPAKRGEDYLDILVRARNWLAQGE